MSSGVEGGHLGRTLPGGFPPFTRWGSKIFDTVPLYFMENFSAGGAEILGSKEYMYMLLSSSIGLGRQPRMARGAISHSVWRSTIVVGRISSIAKRILRVKYNI